MPIYDRFPTGMRIFQIPLSWFRRVTAWLNNFCGGTGIDVSHPSDPSDVSPVMVSIDREWLRDEIKNNTIDPDHLGAGTGADATATDAASGTAANESGNAYDSSETYAQHYGISLDQTTWQADMTKKPLEVFMFSRFFRPSGNVAARFLCGRKFTFAPNGRLLSVSAEIAAYRIRDV